MCVANTRYNASYLWCIVFVLMESWQTVYFGSVLQRISPSLFGALVFGASSIGAIAFSLWTHPYQIRIIRENIRLIVIINVFGTFAWLNYLSAIKHIEPAIALTIYSATIPMTILFIGKTPLSFIGRAGVVSLVSSILFLSTISITGLSGFIGYGFSSTVLSLIGCVVAGIAISVVLLQSKQLSSAGLQSLSVFGLRFMLFAIVSAVIFLYSKQSTSFSGSSISMIIFLGIVLVSVPLYAVQKAIEIANARTVGVFTATTPIVVVLLQIFEGRVSFSYPTLVGITIYATGAILLVLNEIGKNEPQHLS